MSTSEKRAALAELLKQRAAEKTTYPLSSAQLAMWFQQNLEPDNSAYNMPLAFCLHGELQDAAVVEKCLSAVVAKHSVLRTVFTMKDGEPIQLVKSDVPVDVPLRDIESIVEEDWQSQVLRLSGEQARAAFDLSAGSLFRFELLRLSKDLHVLLATFHHIVMDGWSIGVLLQDFSEAYIALMDGRQPKLSVPPLTYGDYVRQQRKSLDAKVTAKQVRYWEKRLDQPPTALDLPTDYTRPTRQTYNGAIHSLSICESLTRKMAAVGGHVGATFFMIALASFYVLLGRLSGQTDIVLGVSTANRERKEYWGLLGLFSEVLPMRANFTDDPSFIDFLQRVKANCLQDYEHAQISLTNLIEAIKPIRDPSRNMLFQVGFDYQNTPWPEVVADHVSLINGDTGSAKLDINLNLSKVGGRLEAVFEYNTDLFAPATIERFANSYTCLLNSIVRDPGQSLSRLAMLGAEERRQIIYDWNDTAIPLPEVSNVMALIEQASGSQPRHTAVVAGNQKISYATLNARANAIAAALLHSGVERGEPVGILLSRTPDLIASLLAVWKAGGCYVPFDTDTPPARLAYIASDAGICRVITERGLGEGWPDNQPVELLYSDSLAFEVVDEPPAIDIDPCEVAYIIYTSGTTGQPKGVVVSHRSLLNHTVCAAREFGLTAADRVLQFASISFDASAEEIFPCLISQATLVLRGGDMLGSVNHFLHACRSLSVSVIDVPTAFWHELVDELTDREEFPEQLRLVIIGGEAAQPKMLGRWLECIGKQVRLLNTYGPTEATVTVTTADLSGTDPGDAARRAAVPIGRPNGNTRIYVVDKHDQPVPPGVCGEILIGGVNVACGYHGKLRLTEEKFVADPFLNQPGERIYRSGDYGRFREDGQLEFRGRADGQIKLRGFRIELDEVEANLRRHPSIGQAAAVVRDVGGDGPRLAVCLVLEPDANPVTAIELRRWLGEYHPPYMVPSLFVFLEEMPLTASGKFDRRALQTMSADYAEPAREMTPPRTNEEQMLASVWMSVLNVDRISVHDNFFELGGHSLLVTKMLSRVQRLMHVDVPLATVFEAPTIASFSREVEQSLLSQQGIEQQPIVPAAREPGAARQVFRQTYAQQRLWFLDKLNPGSSAYNNSSVFQLLGPLDVELLEAALNHLVCRHEILRTVFDDDDGRPLQIVLAEQLIYIELVDLQAYGNTQREEEVARRIAIDAARPFDLVNGPLLRMQVLRCGVREHVLLFNWHHIITDAWSRGVFAAELAAVYRALQAGHEPSLPVLELQYADYAEWEGQWLAGELLQQQTQYWQNKLHAAPASLELPVDRLRTELSERGGALVSKSLSYPVLSGLNDLGHKTGATLFMVCLAAFKLLLSRYSAQTDIIVGTPVSGRRRVELEALIGFFVNTLPLRTDLSGNPAFTELVERVRETALEAYAHQELPFERMVESLGVSRYGGQSPVFRVLFVLENKTEGALELSGLDAVVMKPGPQTAKFDLTLIMNERDDGMYIEWEYSTDLFTHETVERISDHFELLLSGIAKTPDARLSCLPSLPAPERDYLLQTVNDTSHFYPSDHCIHDLISARALSHPEEPALEHAGRVLSHAELDRYANRLAHYLVAQGVGPGRLVGVCSERTPELLVAVLAILKAGGAYVPLDSAYPPSRLAYMLEDAGVRMVLTQRALVEVLPLMDQLVCLDELDTELGGMPDSAPAVAVNPEAVAYVIYTSGSTGEPKGVQIRHRNTVAMLDWAGRAFSAEEFSRVQACTSLSFDLSVFELFAPLCHGGTVVLVDNALSLREQAVDVSMINTVPSVARALLDADAIPAGVRVINLAGEVLPSALVNDLLALESVDRVCNLYGPTEDTTYSTWASFDSPVEGGAQIGRPIDNTRCYVLDEQGELLPKGAVGELYLGGAGVALGYLGRPELTAERFVADGFSGEEGAKLYRTGDLVRWLEGRGLAFIGRVDDQVKIRGFRIEMGEIEHYLRQQPGVRDAAVQALPAADDPGQKQLIAYLAVSDTLVQEVDGSEQLGGQLQSVLQTALRQFLPEFMVPSVYIVLPEFPLTPNGKIDKVALPRPDATELQEHYQAPQNATEQRLTEIWAKLLGLEADRISVLAGFFELGGHSLLLIRLLNEIRVAFDVSLELRALFDATTIRSLALELELWCKRRSFEQRDDSVDGTLDVVEW